MINRCYSINSQERNKTYTGCTVSEEWLTFSDFKAWMVTQDFERKQLDKDLLIEGNKIYSPGTCVFVSGMVNSFTIDRGASRGDCLIGVSWYKPTEKIYIVVPQPIHQEKVNTLDISNANKEAHETWLKRKLELAHELAAIQEDSRVAEALIDRYSNYTK